MSISRLLACAALILIPLGSSSTGAAAQEFRIASEVYMGESKTPLTSNLTLFSDQLICDFLMSDEVNPKPLEVVIFDMRLKQFVLLNMSRKVRTEISDLQLNKLLENLAHETQVNERSKFLISDSFAEETDWANNTLRLKSDNIEYFFQGNQPSEPAILPQYFAFLDNFTRLNATDPRKLPPFPRMKLNQRIKQLGWIPSEIQVTLRSNEFFRETVDARSKHTLNLGLTSKDKELIASAKRDWQSFPAQELPEFRQLRVGIAEEHQQAFGKTGGETKTSLR
jgi:hypothetical protein